jgi:hypothetical protein
VGRGVSVCVCVCGAAKRTGEEKKNNIGEKKKINPYRWRGFCQKNAMVSAELSNLHNSSFPFGIASVCKCPRLSEWRGILGNAV